MSYGRFDNHNRTPEGEKAWWALYAIVSCKQLYWTSFFPLCVFLRLDSIYQFNIEYINSLKIKRGIL